MSKEYLAGIIDGEGTISLQHQWGNSQYRHPQVNVTNTSRPIIDWLHETYGGCIVTQKKYAAHHKQAWIWRVSYRKAMEVIALVAPILKEEEKSRRANLILEKYDSVTVKNGKYTAEQHRAKMEFEKEYLGPFV